MIITLQGVVKEIDIQSSVAKVRMLPWTCVEINTNEHKWITGQTHMNTQLVKNEVIILELSSEIAKNITIMSWIITRVQLWFVRTTRYL